MRITLPTNACDDIHNFIHSFVNNESLYQLVNAFGGQYKSTNATANLKYLLRFSDCWDYRGSTRARTEHDENARWLVGKDSFTDNQIMHLKKAKKDLGLVDNATPKRNEYDYIWVLGGAKLSCLLRTKLAKKIYDGLNCRPRKLSLLGSSRPINDSERRATDTYAQGADTEFDLFVAAHNSIFSHCDSTVKMGKRDNTHSSWIIMEFEDGTSVLSAPSTDPKRRRANSLDTYLFFMKQYNVQPKSTILLVTSEIYVPYQHLEAFRSVVLPNNVEIETVGFPSEWGGELQGMNSDENYLQEIRSAIQSLNRLVDSIS